jgi:hypothetical protein
MTQKAGAHAQRSDLDLSIAQSFGGDIRPRKDQVATSHLLLQAQGFARAGKYPEMLGSKMRVECRFVGIDFVEQHAVTLAFGLKHVKLQASRLGSDGSVRVCVYQAPEFRSRTLFEVEFDDDRKKHALDPVQAVVRFAAMRHFLEQLIFHAMLPKMLNSSKYW